MALLDDLKRSELEVSKAKEDLVASLAKKNDDDLDKKREVFAFVLS